MALTPAQQTVLKIHIEASVDSVIVQALVDGTHDVIAQTYNLNASPDYFFWRSKMPVSEVRELVDWDEVVSQSTADLLAFQILIASDSINPSNASVRQAFTSIFQGGSGINTIAALNGAAKRIGTLGEKVLTAGGGDGSSGTPGNLGFEGNLWHQDVSKALING